MKDQMYAINISIPEAFKGAVRTGLCLISWTFDVAEFPVGMGEGDQTKTYQ